MVKTAAEMWWDLNRQKYKCEACDFCTANRTHWERHKASLKHFLLAELRPNCPRDCKIVIASFLPFTQLTKLGQIGIDAVQYALTDRIKWYNHNQIYLVNKKYFKVVPGDPPSQTVYLGVRRGHTLQSLTFVV